LIIEAISNCYIPTFYPKEVLKYFISYDTPPREKKTNTLMTAVPSLAAATAAASRLRQLSSSSHLPASEMLLQAASSISPSNDHDDRKSQMTPLLAPKRIMFLRHGQAIHNPRAELARENGCSFEEFLQLMQQDDAYDADLTFLGEEQAKQAGSIGSVQDALQNVEMIVSSPLSRAIRTADLFYSTHSKSSPKRVAIEHFREINGKLLNAKRRPRTELETIFPHWNFSHVPSTDTTWTEELEPYHECSERGYQGLLWVMQQKETNLLLVAHGGLLKMAMNDHPRVVLVDGRNKHPSNDMDRCVSQRFGNCELRSYIMCAWKNESETESCLRKTQPVITLEEVTINGAV
jgi:broad specificity phosphatase PhoE